MIPPILQAVARHGYAVFTEGAYNLNIVGIRSDQGQPDAFDDLMTVTYRDETGTWTTKSWPITTDPGLYYLMNADKQLNPAGTAILAAPQQCRGAYGIGLHGRSQYEALTQRHAKVTVWRDNDHDDEIDYEVNPDTGWFGINIHASSSSPYEGDKTTSKVGPWSGGCQVFQNESDFREFMALCKKQLEHHPTWTKYTYTLITTAAFGE